MSYVINHLPSAILIFGNSVVCLCSMIQRGPLDLFKQTNSLNDSRILQQLPEVKEWYEEQNSQISLKETLENACFYYNPFALVVQ